MRSNSKQRKEGVVMDFNFRNPFKNPKRVVAAVLTAAMIFQSLSVAAFADEAEVSDDVVVTEESFETAEELVTGEEEVIIEDSDASEAVEAEALESDDAIESDEESVEAKGEKEAIAATKITDLDGREFLTDDTQFFAEYDYAKAEGVGIKTTWKIKDKNAKLFSLYRLGNDGSFSKVDGTDTCLLDKVSKKSYRDFYAFTDYDEFLTPQNTSGLYVLETYSKEGAYLNSYITLPRTKMIRCDLDSTASALGNKVVVTFVGIKGSQIKYRIEASNENKKSWAVIEDAYVPADDCCFDSVGRPAVKYVDSNVLGLGDRRYYRVTAYAELKGGLTIETKTTKEVSLKQDFPAVTIVDCKNSEPEHPVCYGNANLYVTYNASMFGVPDSKTYFEICRAKGNGEIVAKKQVLVKECATALNGSEVVRVVPFTGVEPDVPYDYYVRVVRNKKIGALSAPYPVLGAYEEHIKPYTYIDASKPEDNEYPIEYVGKKTIKLRWIADDCAKNYYIYRIKNNNIYETLEAAEEAVSRLNAGGIDNDVLKAMNFTKVGLVKNEAIDGNRVSFVDSKAEKSSGYYVYYIYPENLKEHRGYDNGLALMIKTALPTPGDLDIDTTVNSIKFKWEDLKDVGAYRIQRTTALDAEGNPDFTKADYDEVKSEKRCYILQKTTDAAPMRVEVGVRYYYRVMAQNKRTAPTSFSAWSDYKTAIVQNKPIHKVEVKPVFKSGSFLKQIKYKAMTNTDADQVAYYEIVKTTEDSTAAFDAAAAAKNPDSYYSFSSSKKNQKIEHSFDAVRGVDYFFAARPVSNTGIKGDWDKKKEVCLPTAFDLQAVSLLNKPEVAMDGHGDTDTGVHKPFKVAVGSTERILLYFNPADTTYTDVAVSAKDKNIKVEYNPDKTMKIKGVKYHYINITGASEKKCTTLTVYSKNYKDTGSKEALTNSKGTTLYQKFYVRVSE